MRGPPSNWNGPEVGEKAYPYWQVRFPGAIRETDSFSSALGLNKLASRPPFTQATAHPAEFLGSLNKQPAPKSCCQLGAFTSTPLAVRAEAGQNGSLCALVPQLP